MKRTEIPLEAFRFDSAYIRDNWLLLCAGNFNVAKMIDGASRSYNAMTISWGSYGQIWNRMFFQVVVRPTRFTYEFMERYETFTLCGFDSSFKKSLSLLGSKSGRDGDKIAESGLSPIPSRIIAAPGFDEAELIIECRKLYWQDIDNSHFLDPSIESNYPKKDYHRAYFGEIVGISGTKDFIR